MAATLPNMTPQAPTPTTTGPGRVQGVLSRLVHYSRESSFCIARIQSDDGAEGDVTVKGAFPEPDAGVCYEFLGDWVTDPKYGRQLKVKAVSVIRPSTLRGIERYLSSGPFPHVGPSRARALVEKWGLQTLDILDSPDAGARLAAEISGITPARAEPIVTEWREHRGRADHLMQLYRYGLSPWQVGRLVGRYGDRAGEVLTQDPYQVIGEIPRFGFLTVDSIAERMGIARDDLRRARAAVLYLLEQAADEGHTYLPEEGAHGLFTPERAKEVRLPVERLRAGAESLSQTSSHLVHDHECGRLALQSLWTAEDHAAQSLRDLARKPRLEAPLLEAGGIAADQVEILEPTGAESLTPEQADAVRLVQLHRLVVVTGGPGVGKTHSLRAMLDVWHRSGQHVELAAPTGKAAQRMAELTGEPARTIHRLLEWSPDGWGRSKLCPLEADIVVIDETSMVDVDLVAALLDAIHPQKTRMVLIGDVDQLPSVGPGQVLGDLIASGICPVVRLTRIMRQEAGSAIIQAAHAVNRGVWTPPEDDGQDGRGGESSAAAAADLYWVQRPDEVEPSDLARELVRYVTLDLPGSGFNPLREVQVLCPQKRGTLGTEALNIELQRLLNPPADGKGEVVIGPRKPKTSHPVPGKRAGSATTPASASTLQLTLRDGDKVIQVHNDYNLGVFNGEIGFVVCADPGEAFGPARRGPSVQVDFGGEGADGTQRVLTYRDDGLHGLQLAYALTIHKSQGSEFPVVVMPVHTTNFLMLRRRLLYTGLTRARELCLMLGTRRALDRAVLCNEEARRCTRLAELLRKG